MTLPTSWTVAITGASGSAPTDGFIDHRRIEDIMAGGSNPTTLVHTRAKARANARYKFLAQQLQMGGNIYITDMVAAGSNPGTTAPTAFNFTAHVERGDSVLSTEDETAPGTFLTGEDALVRMIARALIIARTMNAQVYDPTVVAAPGNTNTAVRVGNRIESLVIGKVAANLTTAEGLVTVTKVI